LGGTGPIVVGKGGEVDIGWVVWGVVLECETVYRASGCGCDVVLGMCPGNWHLVWHTAFMGSMVLSMYGLVVSIREDGDGPIRAGGVEAWFGNGGAVRGAVLTRVRLLLQERASALSAMMAAAALLLGDGGEVGGVLLVVGLFVEAGLGTLFGFAQVYALLLGVVRLLHLTAVALDMGGSLLAFKTTMLALGDRSALLGDERQLAVWATVSANSM
jgi:hypothetical protein